jgi:hypothetical protein
MLGATVAKWTIKSLGPHLSSPQVSYLPFARRAGTRRTATALQNVDWEKEVEHSVRIAKIILSHVTSRHPDLFQSKDVAWYVETDEEAPK